MFKKLRNNFLGMSCAIIAALLICCFGINYLLVYQSMRLAADRKLENEIKMMERRIDAFESGIFRNGTGPSGGGGPSDDTGPSGGIGPSDGTGPSGGGRRFNGDMSPDRDAPPSSGVSKSERNINSGRNPAFSPTFSIVTDSNGNVTEINMAFAMTEDFYSGLSADIIASGNDHGRIRGTNADSTVSNWRYQYKKIDSGYIIAFTEISSDLATLRILALCLLLIALAAAIVTFFISLFFANRSIRPIEEAYNKQKQFIADASHELKTPLAAINTNIDVLLSRDGADDEEKKWLWYIKDEARRMSKLTNDLLYLARADYGNGNQVFSSVSWTDIVKNALLVMEARVFEQNVSLTSEIADGINIAASEEQLKQLVMILLDNAVKYTPSGGGIELRLFKKTSDAYLTVRNTGAGISNADLPHIFDRFYRSDKARTYTENSGYGLGLAIAKAITESFNGTISAESKTDSYTLFTVKIPLLKA